MGFKVECDSCHRLVSGGLLPDTWGDVTVQSRDYVHTYVLCNECITRPMTFGDLTTVYTPLPKPVF